MTGFLPVPRHGTTFGEQQMETIDFLRSVLGDGDGHYCIFAANAETNKRVQSFTIV